MGTRTVLMLTCRCSRKGRGTQSSSLVSGLPSQGGMITMDEGRISMEKIEEDGAIFREIG